MESQTVTESEVDAKAPGRLVWSYGVESRISRRSFLVSAGATLAAASSWAALAPRSAAAAAPAGIPGDFLTGIGDDFARLAAMRNADAMKIFDSGASTRPQVLRFPLRWDRVAGSENGTLDWSYYAPLHRELVLHGVQALPVIIGCPSYWVERGEAKSTNGDLSYPAGAAALNAFGQFVVDTAAHFRQFGNHLAGVEIWTVPNSVDGAHIPDPAEFSRLVATAAAFVTSATDSGAMREPATVISGGLSLDRSGAWQRYLDGFKSQAFPYALGVHVYPGQLSPGESADRIAADVASMTGAAQRRAGVEAWVTSTAATAGSRGSDEDQAEMLAQLTRRLGQLHNCRAMVVGGFTSPDQGADGRLANGSTLLRSDLSARPGLARLQAEWKTRTP